MSQFQFQLSVVFYLLQNFVNFLESNQTRFSKLRKLTIHLKTVSPTMTGQTVIAFLRYSNIEDFTCVNDLPFTVQDQVKTIAKYISYNSVHLFKILIKVLIFANLQINLIQNKKRLRQMTILVLISTFKLQVQQEFFSLSRVVKSLLKP